MSSLGVKYILINNINTVCLDSFWQVYDGVTVAVTESRGPAGPL